jgi:hypothetical protein
MDDTYGYRQPANGETLTELPVTGYRLQVTGYRLQVIGYRILHMFSCNLATWNLKQLLCKELIIIYG